MDHSNILAKIKKLLAMSEDQRGNEHEAATAARMAQALLEKYNIDMADVIMAEVKNNESIDYQDADIAYRKGKVYKQVPRWASLLATVIAQTHDCQAMHPNAGQVRFMGYSLDTQTAKWIYEYLLRAIYRNTPEGVGIDGARAFRLAAVSVIRERLKKPAAATGTALVVAKQQAIQAKFGVMKYRKVSVGVNANSAAYNAGLKYGREVNLNPGRPVTSNQEKRLLLK